VPLVAAAGCANHQLIHDPMTQSASPDRNATETASPQPAPVSFDLAGWVAELEEFAREVSAELESIRRQLGDSDVSTVAARSVASPTRAAGKRNAGSAADPDLAARRNSMQERLARLTGEQRAGDEQAATAKLRETVAQRVSGEARP
jgi:hypothetical protein